MEVSLDIDPGHNERVRFASLRIRAGDTALSSVLSKAVKPWHVTLGSLLGWKSSLSSVAGTVPLRSASADEASDVVSTSNPGKPARKIANTHGMIKTVVHAYRTPGQSKGKKVLLRTENFSSFCPTGCSIHPRVVKRSQICKEKWEGLLLYQSTFGPQCKKVAEAQKCTYQHIFLHEASPQKTRSEERIIQANDFEKYLYRYPYWKHKLDSRRKHRCANNLRANRRVHV